MHKLTFSRKSRFSVARVIVSRNYIFAGALSCNKILFLCALSRIFRIFSRACIAFINSPISPKMPLFATIRAAAAILPIKGKAHIFQHSPHIMCDTGSRIAGKRKRQQAFTPAAPCLDYLQISIAAMITFPASDTASAIRQIISCRLT